MNGSSGVLSALLFVMVAVWLGLIVWTFHRLRTQHQATYVEIGSPDLFWNNSMRTNWLFLKFLYGRSWKLLGDWQLWTVLHVMQVWLVVYLVGFIALICSMP